MIQICRLRLEHGPLLIEIRMSREADQVRRSQDFKNVLPVENTSAQDSMRLTQKFNESFNKIAGRPEQPTTLVTTGYDVVTTSYGAFDMAGSPGVLPPPPYPPAPDPTSSTYYNFVGLDGLGTVSGPAEWFPGAGPGPARYPTEPTATYLTSSSPSPAGYVDSWQAPAFPPAAVEPLQPISYSAFPPATLPQQPGARYLPVPELDDALNVLQNHAVISNVNPPIVAHKSSGKRKLEEFKTEVDDCQPSSSGGSLKNNYVFWTRVQSLSTLVTN